MATQALAPADLEVVQQVSAGHGPAREEVLGHPVILPFHLQQPSPTSWSRLPAAE